MESDGPHGHTGKPQRPPSRHDPVPIGPHPASTDNATDLARDLEARHPGWVILWRHWARRYWAFPTWLPNTPGPIEARNLQDLLTQINDLEFQHSP
ncbi:hypothetical protein ACFV0L_07120 [Streptosporangium canum]|uniref:hypothetical protein n=1 Tax=Streptosporangium canum TaxID=324952 RepID=UPI0036C9C0AE